MQSLRMALTVAGPRLTPRSVVAGACDPVSSVRSGAAAIVGGLTWDSASRRGSPARRTTVRLGLSASPGTQPHEETARLGARQPRLGLSLEEAARLSLAWDSASQGGSPASCEKARALDLPQTGRGLEPRDSIGAASIGAATKLMSHVGRPGTARQASTRPTRSRPPPAWARRRESARFLTRPRHTGSGSCALYRDLQMAFSPLLAPNMRHRERARRAPRHPLGGR